MVETYIGGLSNQTLFALTRLRLCMQSRAGDFVSIVRTDTCTKRASLAQQGEYARRTRCAVGALEIWNRTR